MFARHPLGTPLRVIDTTSKNPTSSGVVRLGLVVAVTSGVLLAACSGSDSGTTSTSTENDGAGCGVQRVGDVQTRTFCGDGTSTAKSGAVNLTIPKASCETSRDFVAVNAGTIVLGATEAANKVKATTQYIGLAVGRVPGDTTSDPAPADGTYTGGVLTVNDKGRALLPDANSLKVTLTKDRTAGSFSGALRGGGTVTGTFSC